MGAFAGSNSRSNHVRITPELGNMSLEPGHEELLYPIPTLPVVGTKRPIKSMIRILESL